MKEINFPIRVRRSFRSKVVLMAEKRQDIEEGIRKTKYYALVARIIYHKTMIY